MIVYCIALLVLSLFATSRSNRLHNKLFTLRGGDDVFDSDKRTDFVVGKDRELLHFSIDLKWLFEKLCDKATWMEILDYTVQSFLRLSHGYETEFQYRLQATKMYKQLQAANTANCSVRVFQSSLADAQHLSIIKDRFILFYCEEELADVIPSMDTILARKALASSRVGNFINDQYIFMTGYHRHPYAKYISTLIESTRTKKPVKYPYFVILAPKESMLSNDPSKPVKYSRRLQLEVLGTFSEHFKHINALTLEKFLMKILLENKHRMRFEYSLPTGAEDEVLTIESSSRRSNSQFQAATTSSTLEVKEMDIEDES